MSDELEERLRLLVPINNLTPQQQARVFSSAEILELRKKDFIFRQGDRDNFSYYILEGNIEMYADDQLIKKISGGEAASFQALAQLQPRQMSAQAKTKAKILRVDRILVDQLLTVEEQIGDDEAREIEVSDLDDEIAGDWLTQMLQSELFAKVPPSNIQRLLDTLETVEYKAGDDVIRQGDVGDFYYAIQTGRCEVLRMASSKKEIRLAELGPGARFGEESLVSNAKRNATVRMLTDGELARLTKEDFIELIKKPVLKSCTLDEARQHVENGCQWLDVRFPEEHHTNGLQGSINIPLSNLRNRLNDIDRDKTYIAYCDTGGRSSAASFLLTQAGVSAVYVENGAIDEVPAELARGATAATTPAPEPTPPEPEISPENEELIEANARAESLNADVEKANLQIERAQKLMEEAEAAKREADRLVAEKLSHEREKLEQRAKEIETAKLEAQREAANTLRLEREKLLREAEEIEATKQTAAQRAEQQLREEREKLQQEAQQVHARLEEAKALKDQLAQQQRAAQEEVARRFKEQQEKTVALQNDAEKKLQQKEAELDALYLKQADELEKLQNLREQSTEELERARQEIEVESTVSKERIEAIKAMEQELEKKEQSRLAALSEKEEQMKAELQTEIDQERKKLESEFARTQAEIEKAKAGQRAAEAARIAAAEEAEEIVRRYKAEQHKKYEEQHKKLLAERQKIEIDAKRLQEEMARAQAARAEAEKIKEEAEAKLTQAVAQQASDDEAQQRLRQEIAAIEKQAKEATEQLRNAIKIENAAEVEHRAHEEKLEHSYNTHAEVNILLQSELDEWVKEQEKLQESTAQQNARAKQQELVERIKRRAVESKQSKIEHDRSLLDEIASKLEE